MNTALIPHPAFSTASPLITARELVLAAACAGLKEQLIGQAVNITRLEESNRTLQLRNAELTKALHRAACSGSVMPEVLTCLGLTGLALLSYAGHGLAGLGCYWLGFVAGVVCLAFAALRTHRQSNTPRRRAYPAEIQEPADDARIVNAIRRAPEPRGYLADLVIDEVALLPAGAFYGPDDLHRPMLERATRHAEAEAEREAFFATAARLNLERGRFEAVDHASL